MILNDFHFATVYLDDVAIVSNTWEDHLDHLNIVVVRARHYELTINLPKLRLAQKSIRHYICLS